MDMRIALLLASAAVLWTAAATAFDSTPLVGLPAAMARGEYPKTTSVVVAQNGKIVSEQWIL